MRDDLRIAAYLDQRFAAAGVPSDEDVAAYFTAHRDEFDRSSRRSSSAAPVIRERLSAERRAELIADWIADLRRRTPVVELWKKNELNVGLRPKIRSSSCDACEPSPAIKLL